MLKTYKDLNKLPQDARVWVFPSTRIFLKVEIEQIQAQLDVFLFQWAAHGADLTASSHILFDRFIVVMLDETKVGASGCSIDSLTHFTQKIEKEYNTSFTNRMNVSYLENEDVKDVHLNSAKELINSEIIFFNHLVSNKTEFEKSWLTPVRNSWLERFI